MLHLVRNDLFKTELSFMRKETIKNLLISHSINSHQNH
ncbi:Uncharacterised protein [Serratia fonticola]|nr:hypothetical protein DFO62_10454 [Serratia fonticola]CAI0890549.1 Uncharacterised protein [Serratia fonticola]CAI1090073.1 Uncharacterised protein [Serratia fonticola]